MRRDWLIFCAIIRAIGFPIFSILKLLEQSLPYQVSLSLAEHPYVEWAIFTAPTAVASNFVWNLYVIYRFGFGAFRLLFGLATAMPLLLTWDKKKATVLRVAQGVVDFVIFACVALVALWVVADLLGRFGIRLRNRT